MSLDSSFAIGPTQRVTSSWALSLVCVLKGQVVFVSPPTKQSCTRSRRFERYRFPWGANDLSNTLGSGSVQFVFGFYNVFPAAHHANSQHRPSGCLHTYCY